MKNILKSFFMSTSSGKFSPVFFWVTILMTLVIVMTVMRLCGRSAISDTLLLGTLGGVQVFLGLYNMRRVSDKKIEASKK